MKKILCRVLAMMMALSFVVFLLPADAYAATTTINNFSAKTVLTTTQLDVLKTGSYSAVKRSGQWYYKFTKKNNTIYVKVSAFTGSSGNSFSNLNKQLSNGVTKRGIACGEDFIYKYCSGKVKRNRVELASKSYNKSALPSYSYRNEYATELSHLDIWAQRADENIKLSCEVGRLGSVKFVYSDKIQLTWNEASAYPGGLSANQNGYVAPSTAAQYVRALKRSTSSGLAGDTSKTLAPNFKVSVVKPGDNKVHLANVVYAGKGKAETTKNIDKYVSIAYATGKLAAKVACKEYVGALKDLGSVMASSALDLLKTSNAEYQSRKAVPLSRDYGNRKVISYISTFRSPIKLKNSEDYFQVDLNLSREPSTTKNKTVIQVEFSDKRIK